MANQIIDSLQFNGSGADKYMITLPQAYCSSGQNDVAKVATLSSGGTFVLTSGARVSVTFARSNTVSSPTLNVGGTGAKPIYSCGSQFKPEDSWDAGSTLDFIYDGAHWILIGTPSDGAVGYYGSDSANSNGWYKVCEGNLTGHNDVNLNLLITSCYATVATGLLNIHLRCNNQTTILIQSLKWMYRYGFSANTAQIVTTNNDWALYILRNPSSNQHGRIEVKVLSSAYTTGYLPFTLTSNVTKETTDPAGTFATDGATVSYAYSAGTASALNSTGTAIANKLRITNYDDIGGNRDTDPPFMIGPETGTHIEMDNNEIAAKQDATTIGDLGIQVDGGSVSIGTSDVVQMNYGSSGVKQKWNIRGNLGKEGQVIKSDGTYVVWEGPWTGKAINETTGTAKYVKICTVKIPSTYKDFSIELTLCGRSKYIEKVNVLLARGNSTTITANILYSGHYGNIFNVHGYRYTDTTNGDYFELWCDLKSWDSLNIHRDHISTNYNGEATWNWNILTALPTTSTTVVKINASAEIWSGRATVADTATNANNIKAENLAGKTLSLNTLTLATSDSPQIKYYYCPADGSSENITGRPKNSAGNELKQAFNLKVEQVRFASTTDYITKQTYIHGAGKATFTRYCVSGTWNDWAAIADTTMTVNAATNIPQHSSTNSAYRSLLMRGYTQADNAATGTYGQTYYNDSICARTDIGELRAKTMVLTSTQDATGTQQSQPALIVGGTPTTSHIQMDYNEIIAKTNATTPGELALQTDGGILSIGTSGNVQINFGSSSNSNFSKWRIRDSFGTNGQVVKSDGTYVYWGTDNDSKASSSNSTSKLFLVGATAQSTAGQTTYSNSNVYVSSGILYTNAGAKATGYSGSNGGLTTPQFRNIAIASDTNVTGMKVGDIIFISSST